MTDLNNDVLLNILHFCDIQTILTFGRTCKRFHALALERETWASHVQKLYERGFVDLYPGQNVNQLSREDLVGHTKRSHAGPSTWQKYCTPEITSTCRLKLPSTGASESSNRQEAILVPGGQYVVFRSQGGDQLACWNLATKKLIWSYEPQQEGYWFRGMAVDIFHTEDGTMIDIIVGLRRMINVEVSRENIIEYIRLNPRTREVDVLFTEEVADTSHDYPFGTLMITGDYALSYLANYELTIYNRVTEVFTRHKLGSMRHDHQNKISLLKSHLVVMTRNPFWNDFTLTLFDLKVLQDEASSAFPQILEVRNSTKAEKFNTAVDLFTSDANARDTRQRKEEEYVYHDISCRASPIRENVWCIWILMSAPNLRPSYGRLQKYTVEYPEDSSSDSKPLVKQLFSIGPIEREQRLPMWTSGISWAGFVQENFADTNHLYMFAEMGQPKCDLQLPGRGDHVSMNPYSGTVTYTTPKEIVVNYYK